MAGDDWPLTRSVHQGLGSELRAIWSLCAGGRTCLTERARDVRGTEQGGSTCHGLRLHRSSDSERPPDGLAGVAGLPRARIVVTSPLVLLTQRPDCERRGRARVRLWPLPRTLRAGRSEERPSPESSRPAACGGSGRSAAEQARAARAIQERCRASEGLWAPGVGRAARPRSGCWLLLGINRLIAATVGHGDHPHPPRLDLAVSARSGSAPPRPFMSLRRKYRARPQRRGGRPATNTICSSVRMSCMTSCGIRSGRF